MLESGFTRYCLYGSAIVISSEILYHGYLWLRNRLEERSSSQEINEVIWTNEFTQYCAGQHRYNSRNASDNGGGTFTGILKLGRTLKPNAKCDNLFCAAKSVGRVIEYIDSAKYCIELAMYTFTSFELSEALLRAHQRGVLIRIITDHEMAYSTGSQIIPLTKAGVPVRCNSNNVFMHHKFCILDSPRRVDDILKKQNKKSAYKGLPRSVLLTGSLNWTMQGFCGNWENILITNNMNCIRQYSTEFERMWRVFECGGKN